MAGLPSDLPVESVLEESQRQRSPLVELLVLAAPTVAQMASYTLLQFVDTWMLSRVGALEATAAGNAGMAAFSLIGFGIGVLTLVNTLVSQNFGRGSFSQCGSYLWQGIWFSVLFALLILPTVLFAHGPFRVSGHEAALVEQEAIYYRICVYGTAFKLASTAMGQFLIGINQPGLVLVAAIASVLANVLANWVLIFGHWGFPAMGVAGAAWGTNIALLVECLMLGAFALRPQLRRTFGVNDWRFRAAEMKTLLRIGLPTGGQYVADILAWTLFMMLIMGVYGTNAMAGNTFAFRFWVLSFMPAIGVGAAVTALVGRYIGMGRPDIAESRAHLGFMVTAVYMLTCGVFFFVYRYELIDLFTDDPEIIQIGATVLIFGAIYQAFDAVYLIYNSALRGAGDTLVPALAVFVLCWGITVGGGYLISRYWTELGPGGPWLAATFYGATLGLFMFVRFKLGRWKAIRLEPGAALDRLPGFEVLAATPDAPYLGETASRRRQ